MAYDILEQSNRFADKYNQKTKEQLDERLTLAYTAVGGESVEVKKLFYQMYANPVYNKLKSEE